ncbi:dipeptidase [Nonomuraea typhae]|uniref:dipeptidase n=1 Tax=Nonomuraea typhae TaxID=2603600 RepID=UPI0012F98BF7|nr:membrane dipeptidase [Nonomuraea typhae]
MPADYTSFAYLGERYTPFDLDTEFDRVQPYEPGLSPEQAERAERFMREHLIINLHEHPQIYPRDIDQAPAYARSGREHLAYRALAASGVDVVFDNMMGPTGCITSHHGWKWEDVVHDVGMRLADVAHQDRVRIARSVREILDCRESGQIALVLAIEAATPIENELDRLDLLYGFGVRQLGLVYNGANQIGSGLAEDRDGGLTRFGRQVVDRMNRLGMSIDLSHAGDRTSLDAIEASAAPVMITHAGARTVWPTERMKPDVVLRALAGAGGLLGVEAAPHSTVSEAHPRHSIDSVMDHFLYCVELMGLDHVTFGPDTLFGDHVGVHRVFASLFGTGDLPGPQGEPDPLTKVGVRNPVPERVEYCAGMENPGESLRNAVAWLVGHGWPDADIAKVTGGNVLRVLRESWVR